ncbi:MAG: ATP-binding protein, partial [Gammaproteobacteria bacterium]|nr:ATP-binding protein [Gammaproteobacteria bacterium]
MKHLLDIVEQAEAGPAVHFRKSPYGSAGSREFLRDALAMANASVEGPRYIVVGIDVDANGKRSRRAVPDDDFAGKPSYQSLIADFVEPPIRVQYRPVISGGKQVGVFEFADCQDRPYMMRVDHSETLRRGDAYTRVQKTIVKMGRQQLQTLFEQKFRESVDANSIEIGFPGEILHKEMSLSTVDLSAMPSAVAASKIKQMIDARESAKAFGSTTVMSRLMHARLFGSDAPYVKRTPEELLQEMSTLRKQHEDDDLHFLFEQNAREIQMVVLNQGQEPIKDASLSLAMPNHSSFFIASSLPKIQRDDKLVARDPDEQSRYPSVSQRDDMVKVSHKIGEIAANSPVEAFASPLRVCAGLELKGRKIGIRYCLFGQN